LFQSPQSLKWRWSISRYEVKKIGENELAKSLMNWNLSEKRSPSLGEEKYFEASEKMNWF